MGIREVKSQGNCKAWRPAGLRLQRTLCLRQPVPVIHVSPGPGMPLTYIYNKIESGALIYQHCNDDYPALMFRQACDLKLNLRGYAATDPSMVRIGVVHGGQETFFDLDKLIRIAAA